MVRNIIFHIDVPKASGTWFDPTDYLLWRIKLFRVNGCDNTLFKWINIFDKWWFICIIFSDGWWCFRAPAKKNCYPIKALVFALMSSDSPAVTLPFLLPYGYASPHKWLDRREPGFRDLLIARFQSYTLFFGLCREGINTFRSGYDKGMG